MEELLRDYGGFNPYIKHLKKMMESGGRLSPFDNEYLKMNFRYSGYDFGYLSLNVGRRNVEYLNKQFGTNSEFTEIKINYLYGETSEVYHFAYKNRSFFVYKDDCENPFKKQINQVTFDAEKWDNNNKANRKLFPHQIEGIKFMKLRNPAFNWDDMGLGKTCQSIVAALDNGYKNILVITLASLKLNWRREIETYNETAKIISGSVWDNSPSTFTIINYEILKNFISVKKSKNTDKATNDLLLQNFDCIILDEIHRAKNPTSIQSSCIKMLASQRSVQKIIGLSGTPIERNIDFYNICRTINKNISDVIVVEGWFQDVLEKYKEYAFTYCNAYEQVMDSAKTKVLKAEILELLSSNVKGHSRVKTILNIIQQKGNRNGRSKTWSINVNNQNKSVSDLTSSDCDALLRSGFEDNRKKVIVLGRKIGDKKVENTNSEELYQRIKHAQIIRKKTEVLDFFPTKYVFPLYFELSPNEKLKYRELWEEYMLEKNIKNVNVEDLMVVSQSIKMREFLSKIKIPHTTNFVDNKIDEGLKVIIFTHFKEEYEGFLKHFGKIAVGINATMTQQKKQELIDRFQKDDDVKVIIGNIKTLGTGHNLTKGDIAIINSPDWNSGEHEQAEARSWRIGRTEDVSVYYCLFENSHEEEVFERSKQKQENKQIFMQN
jgi:SNF2 family DNA or RNA helicase